MKNYKNELILASIGLRVAAVAVSILALTCNGDMIVQPILCCVNMCNKTCLVAVALKLSGFKLCRHLLRS